MTRKAPVRRKAASSSRSRSSSSPQKKKAVKPGGASRAQIPGGLTAEKINEARAYNPANFFRKNNSQSFSTGGIDQPLVMRTPEAGEEKQVMKAAVPGEEEKQVMKAAAPDDKSVMKAEAPAEKEVMKAEEPAEKEVMKAEEPAEKEVMKAEAPAEKEVMKAEAPAEKEVMKAEAPAEKEVMKAEAPAEKEVMKAEAPAEKEVMKAEEPAEKEVMKAEAPAEKEVMKAEEKEVQGKGITAGGNVSNSVSQRLTARTGQGSPLPAGARQMMEARFGADFSAVRVHNDPEGQKMSKSLNAQAFAYGRDIYFSPGKFDTTSKEGQHLLAHELTHTLQQTGGMHKVQKAHVPDTGFRYSPPSTVHRTIREIQGIVGATPDGVYGQDTKNAVEAYQRKLAALGLYTDTIDGKWGNHTETAFLAFASGPLAEGYNCAGFAFKNYRKIGQADTAALLAPMTQLADCNARCAPWQFKFWFWQYDRSVQNTLTGVTSASSPDFHIVGGQTDGRGAGPTHVMSKNGKRPVEGPLAPSGWYPVNAPLRLNTYQAPLVPNNMVIRSNVNQACYCSSTLPA